LRRSSGSSGSTKGRDAFYHDELFLNLGRYHYFGIDHEIVWGVVERDLPALKQLVQEVLTQ
jgi:hypothetical protein